MAVVRSHTGLSIRAIVNGPRPDDGQADSVLQSECMCCDRMYQLQQGIAITELAIVLEVSLTGRQTL